MNFGATSMQGMRNSMDLFGGKRRTTFQKFFSARKIDCGVDEEQKSYGRENGNERNGIALCGSGFIERRICMQDKLKSRYVVWGGLYERNAFQVIDSALKRAIEDRG